MNTELKYGLILITLIGFGHTLLEHVTAESNT
jgi:hypothetical protein